MQELLFQLTGDFIELNHLLKLTGVCASGGAGKALVATGKVRVDGVVELRKTCKIRAGQAVRVDDVPIRVLGVTSERRPMALKSTIFKAARSKSSAIPTAVAPIYGGAGAGPRWSACRTCQ